MSTAKAVEKEIESALTDHYQQYYRLAYSYVGNEQDALDIVQESAYKAIKNSRSIKEESYIQTWIYRIVVNTALDFLRKKRPEVPYEEQGEESYYEPLQSEAIDLLKCLDEKERAVIILRYFEDCRLEDISRILDENLNTVKARLYRSLKKLKLDLTETGISGGYQHGK